jgi:hypothetical protein
MRTSLLLLLAALALTSTVSYAQDGKPQSEPAQIKLPAAEPGEELFIVNVTFESAEQLAALQQLGFSCAEDQLCEIEATEAQLSMLREAGFAVDIVGILVESSPEVGALESYRSGGNTTDYHIPDQGEATSTVNIAGAPPSARVTRVRYDCLVAAIGLVGGPDQFTLDIRPNSMSSRYTIWNREGGDTDRGRDDDAADDRDIYLNDRWANTQFDGEPVNQAWHLRAKDHRATLFGAGEIDYFGLRVYYCTGVPGSPIQLAPDNAAHICDTTPTLQWRAVSGSTRYHIQVDDNNSFSSPARTASTTGTSYTTSLPLARKRWYWRVRAENECGYGPWSPTRSFTIDSPATAPTLLAPAHGALISDTTPFFDWTSASKATSYRIQVDNDPSFLTPVLHHTPTSSNYTPSSPLPYGPYYWRVRSESACSPSAWSSTRHFVLMPAIPNRPPTNGTLTPNSGGAPAGNLVYFTSNYHDPDGEADLKACRLHIGRWAAPKSLASNAVVLYQARTNKILLRNDRGTRWWGGRLVGSSNVVQNGQVKVYCNRTSVTRGGTRIEVRWGLEFKPAFRGRTKVYLKARDLGGLTSDLEQRGTWTVQ